MEKKNSQKPLWLKISQAEVEKIAIDLAKKGISAEKIGLILRDQYGIPSTRIYGKKICQILKEHNLEATPDITNLEKRLERLNKHAKLNKQDKKTKRAISILTVKLRKLKKQEKKQKNKKKENKKEENAKGN